MSFESQVADSFANALNFFRSSDAESCLMRWPVNRNGTDKAGTKDYDCIQAPSPDAMMLVAGGMVNDYQFSITALKADFATAPRSGDLFLRKGRVARILVVEDGSATVDVSPVYYLHCGQPDK